MYRVSLEGSAGVRSVAELGTFVESGFPCPGRGSGWLGFWGWGYSGWESRLVHQGGARAGVPRPVWTVSISGFELAWASLGMGNAGVWHISLLCCWPDDGTSFWDIHYIYTF